MKFFMSVFLLLSVIPAFAADVCTAQIADFAEGQVRGITPGKYYSICTSQEDEIHSIGDKTIEGENSLIKAYLEKGYKLSARVASRFTFTRH